MKNISSKNASVKVYRNKENNSSSPPLVNGIWCRYRFYWPARSRGLELLHESNYHSVLEGIKLLTILHLKAKNLQRAPNEIGLRTPVCNGTMVEPEVKKRIRLVYFY